MWKQEEEKKKKLSAEKAATQRDVAMDDGDKNGDGRDSKKHRRMFANPATVIRNMFFGGAMWSDDESGDEDDSDESSDHGDDMEHNVMVNQNYFGN